MGNRHRGNENPPPEDAGIPPPEDQPGELPEDAGAPPPGPAPAGPVPAGLAPDDNPLRTMVVRVSFFQCNIEPHGMVYPERQQRNRRGKLVPVPADSISLDLRIPSQAEDYQRWILRGLCADAATLGTEAPVNDEK